MNDLRLRQIAIVLTMAKAIISFILISKSSYYKGGISIPDKGIFNG